MSSRAIRVGVAEAKARFAEVVGNVGRQRTIIQRRGKDVAVLIGIDELAKLEEARAGHTAGNRLLGRLAEVRDAAGVDLDLAPERLSFIPRDGFGARKSSRR